jgi:hypothetical protein
MSFSDAFRKGAEKKMVPKAALEHALESGTPAKKLISQLMEQVRVGLHFDVAFMNEIRMMMSIVCVGSLRIYLIGFGV